MKDRNLGKALAVVGICAMGLGCMYLTNGTTGVGWAVLGIAIIW